MNSGGQRITRVPFRTLSPARTTVIYDTYWRFAAERQRIFFTRQSGSPAPWTDDSVLTQYKFTNVYRASDRVSQYLIRNIIYEGSQDTKELFFRILLFKFFNRIETWETLKRQLGDVSYKEYQFERYDKILTAALENRQKIYSAAYIMPSGGALCTSGKKHRMHLELLDRMMSDGLPERIKGAKSLRQVFETLREYPTIGDFLAYQYTIDLNYSTLLDYSENDFVVPGPGARNGISKCFSDLGGLTEAEIIRLVCDRQHLEFERLGIDFKSLWGRTLHMIDCQNLFCEVDKYARVHHPEFLGDSGRKRIKQNFKPHAEPISYWYPPKWGLNDKIQQERRKDENVSNI